MPQGRIDDNTSSQLSVVLVSTKRTHLISNPNYKGNLVKCNILPQYYLEEFSPCIFSLSPYKFHTTLYLSCASDLSYGWIVPYDYPESPVEKKQVKSLIAKFYTKTLKTNLKPTNRASKIIQIMVMWLQISHFSKNFLRVIFKGLPLLWFNYLISFLSNNWAFCYPIHPSIPEQNPAIHLPLLASGHPIPPLLPSRAGLNVWVAQARL